MSIIFVVVLFLILCVLVSVLPDREAPRNMPARPAEIYYPNQLKKKESHPSQPSRLVRVEEATPPQEAITNVPPTLPRPPCINEFRRPRRAVRFQDILNSKFNYAPERNSAERVPIPQHDVEVYREAERL